MKEMVFLAFRNAPEFQCRRGQGKQENLSANHNIFIFICKMYIKLNSIIQWIFLLIFPLSFKFTSWTEHSWQSVCNKSECLVLILHKSST